MKKSDWFLILKSSSRNVDRQHRGDQARVLAIIMDNTNPVWFMNIAVRQCQAGCSIPYLPGLLRTAVSKWSCE